MVFFLCGFFTAHVHHEMCFYGKTYITVLKKKNYFSGPHINNKHLGLEWPEGE